ncbi:hypothetical protein HYU89_04825 [Candidatus Collierbacteria bacterium]|nr:hypothetical protein [Candidatus Collierbacteria bacterium]
MITTVPITAFRKDLFKYAGLVSLEGYEVEVENKGRKIFKVTKMDDDLEARAGRALELAEKLVGKITFDRKLFRNKKEREYMKHLGES